MRWGSSIDIVNRCDASPRFPSDPGYFVFGGNGTASNVNQLLGDWFFIDNSRAVGDNLVSVEAEANEGVSGYTFYRRYTLGGEDNREPLGSIWAARYFTGGAFDGGTKWAIWRDAVGALEPGSCDSFPAPSQGPILLGAVPQLPPVPTTFKDDSGTEVQTSIDLPWATNLIDVTELSQNPFDSGTATLDFSQEIDRGAFVLALGVSATGDLTDLGATALTIDCEGPIFDDGFESGDTTVWSRASNP